MATTQSTTKVVFNTTFSVAETTADYFTVTPPLVSPRNDIYGQRVTTQIWVMLLIGWGKFPFLAGPMRSTKQIWVVTRRQ